MISVEQVFLRQGAFQLDDVSFTVETGQYAVLMGRTGSGKTSLLEAIAGLRPIRSGRVALAGRDVTSERPGARGVGYVPQDAALFQSMTVRDNIGFALAIRNIPRRELRERVDEMADMLGIAHLLERRPRGLSGGEAQRVALGRALAARPPVLLLDEPLSALDESTREEMYRLLRKVRDGVRVTALHVTHSRTDADKLADVVLRLRDGKIVSS